MYRVVAMDNTTFIVCVTFIFACCLPVVESGFKLPGVTITSEQMQGTEPQQNWNSII